MKCFVREKIKFSAFLEASVGGLSPVEMVRASVSAPENCRRKNFFLDFFI